VRPRVLHPRVDLSDRLVDDANCSDPVASFVGGGNLQLLPRIAKMATRGGHVRLRGVRPPGYDAADQGREQNEDCKNRSMFHDILLNLFLFS
jgi:hypothetical protein